MRRVELTPPPVLFPLPSLIPHLLISALSPQTTTFLVRRIRIIMFPKGFPVPSPPDPTLEEQAAMRVHLETLLLEKIPCMLGPTSSLSLSCLAALTLPPPSPLPSSFVCSFASPSPTPPPLLHLCLHPPRPLRRRANERPSAYQRARRGRCNSPARVVGGRSGRGAGGVAGRSRRAAMIGRRREELGRSLSGGSIS